MKPVIELDAEPVIELGETMLISLMKSAGEVPDGVEKDGSTRMASYAAGSAILHDRGGKVLCGPIDPDGIGDLAVAIVLGDGSRRCNPQESLRLATALIALAYTLEHRQPDGTVPTLRSRREAKMGAGMEKFHGQA